MSAFFMSGRARTRRPSARALTSAFALALCVGSAACEGREPGREVTRDTTAAVPRVSVADRGAAAAARDDYGTIIAAAAPAHRIVSLNPTTTEILFALGEGGRVIGRSRWDQWPDAARAVPALGDAIRPSVEQVLAARPDLVLLYASGDNRAAADAIANAGIPVVALRIDRIADFERCVRILGTLTGRRDGAQEAIDSVRRTLDVVRRATQHVQRTSVFLHVWDNPLMAIGGGSFMSELVEIAGGRNVYADLPAPSPQVSFEDLVRRDPDAILAGPLEVSRLNADARWRSLRAVRDGRVLAYDTSLVARPSMRLGEAARSLARLLHPDVVLP